jgi:double-stranded uracil-DNA glycosylase
VFFNGAKAEACYRRCVLPHVTAPPVEYRRLPSTSPANASQSRRARLAAWRAIRHEGQRTSAFR